MIAVGYVAIDQVQIFTMTATNWVLYDWVASDRDPLRFNKYSLLLLHLTE